MAGNFGDCFDTSYPTTQRVSDFSAALQEWEADLDKYEAEYGQAKAISDEDKRAVVLSKAPTALKQHLLFPGTSQH